MPHDVDLRELETLEDAFDLKEQQMTSPGNVYTVSSASTRACLLELLVFHAVSCLLTLAPSFPLPKRRVLEETHFTVQ